MGFVKVANENMCRPIRALTQAKGYDTSRHVLACFGGAGGQHACAVARSLGMATVYIHKYVTEDLDKISTYDHSINLLINCSIIFIALFID